MSIHRDTVMPRRWRPLLFVAAAGLLVLALGLASCDQDVPQGSEVPPPILPTATPAAPPDATPTGSSSAPGGTPTGASTSSSAPLEPEVISWGGTGNDLAIVIRNQADRKIRRGRVLITVLDDQQRPVLATIGRPASKCCTVLGLPPGEEYGLFMELNRPVSSIAQVLVRYVELELADEPDDASIEVRDAELTRTVDDAVVDATFTARGDIGPFLVGQAFLVDPGGRLVGVISGRFYCFAPGTTHRLRMKLLRPVPPGTRVDEVVGYPIPAGEPAHVQATCT